MQSFAAFLRTHRALLDPAKPAYERGVVLIKVKPSIAPVVEGATTFGIPRIDELLSSVGAYRVTNPFQFNPSNAAEPAGAARDNDLTRIYAVNYVSTQDPVEVSERLMLDPNIEYAEPSPIRYCMYDPNDFSSGDSKYYQIDRTHVADAWGYPESREENGVLIAIVDSGVDIDHEEFANILWTNTRAGQDGYTGDDYGVDLVGSVSDAEAQNGIFRPDGNPRPGLDHGTHVAGCADAQCNNGVGMCGTGFNCRLMSIKCGTDNTSGNAIYRGYEGIQWAAEHIAFDRAHGQIASGVINCSWGGQGISQTEQSVIDFATLTQDVVVVVAAGNSTNDNDMVPFGPASLDRVLSVGATGYDENLQPPNVKDYCASFSCYGTTVRTWAPGVQIYSAVPTPLHNLYAKKDGTSMASPVVAGIAAMVRKRYPSYSALQVIEQMHVYSRIPFGKGNREKYYGMINALDAVSNDSLPGCIVTGTQSISGTTSSDTVGLQVTLKNLLKTSDNLQGVLSIALPTSNLTIPDNFNRASFLRILSGQSSSKTFNVVLAPGVSRVQTRFLLKLVDGSFYEDYILFTAVVTRSGVVSWNFNSTPALPLQSVRGISDNLAWAVGGSKANQRGVIYNTLDGNYWSVKVAPTGSSPESKQAHFCVDALLGKDQTQRVWTGSSTQGAEPARVFYSGYSDATGFAWTGVDVSSITPFVNNIHFFDPVHGIILGDPLGGKWGIASSSDGGRSWAATAASLPATSLDTAWANAADWIDARGWFGTNTTTIYRTQDSGKTWTAASAPYANAQGIAFTNANTGIAFFNPSGSGTSHLARTVDGGVTWTPLNGPASNVRYAGIAYAKGSSAVWLCGSLTTAASDVMFVSSNNGDTWTPQTVPAGSTAPEHMALGFGAKSGNATTMTGWMVGNAIVDFNQQFTTGVHDQGGAGVTQPALECFPNPASERTLLRTTLSDGRRPVSLHVYNAVGQCVADASAELRPGAPSVAAVFDASQLAEGMYYAILVLNDGSMRTTPLSVVHR